MSEESERRREYEEIKRLYRETLSALKEIRSAIQSLESTIQLSALIQLCRDNERDAKVIGELSKVMNKYLINAKEGIRKGLDTYVKEMNKIDDELNKNLVGVYEVILEFTKRIKEIKGIIDTGEGKESKLVGLERLNELRREMIDFLRRTVHGNKERIINIYDRLINVIQGIREEKDRTLKVLNRFSIMNTMGGPAIIGVPVMKLSVNKEEVYVLVSKEFERYREGIISSAKEHTFGVNRALLDKAINLLKQRRGVIYRLFLDKVVKVGEHI